MDEILVNATTARLQHEPAVAPFIGTHFMVTWTDTSDATIKCQLFSNGGDRTFGEVVVNKPTPPQANTKRGMPAIAACGGGLAVAWIESAFNPPGPRPHVKGQRFDRDGRKIGPEFQVSTTEIDPKQAPAVAGLIDGGFVVTWADARQDRRIRAQRFQEDGSKNGADFAVNTTDGFHENPIVIPLAGDGRVQGNFVVAWRADPSPAGGGDLVLRVLEADGTPVTGEIPAQLDRFAGEKAMTFLDGGRFVVAWVSHQGQSDIGEEKSVVKARIFEGDGTRTDLIFFATTAEGEITSRYPAAAPLPGGRFVLSWAQKRADTVATNHVVRAKVFSEIGSSVGNAIQVNTSVPGDRFEVCAATAFGDGEVAFVAWADDSKSGGDASDFAVKARPLPVIASGGFA